MKEIERERKANREKEGKKELERKKKSDNKPLLCISPTLGNEEKCLARSQGQTINTNTGNDIIKIREREREEGQTGEIIINRNTYKKKAGDRGLGEKIKGKIRLKTKGGKRTQCSVLREVIRVVR